jgi:BlaR1 peptidase M56
MTLKRSAARPSAALQKRWQERLKMSGLGRPLTLGVSNRIARPAVAGYCRPAVLLPSSVVDLLSGDELDQILLHELAHVRRYDDWAITVQRCVEALLVLHPLVPLVAKKIELEREIACDDWVLSIRQPQSYASCLTKLAEFCMSGRANRLTTAAVEHKAQLSRRIEMLLDRTRSIATRASLRDVGRVAAILLALSLMSLRTPRLMASPAPQSPPPPQAPIAPQAPMIPKSNDAVEPPAPPKPPQPPAPPPPPGDVYTIIIYSGDGHASVYQNRGSGEISVRPSADKAGTVEFRRNGKTYVIRDPEAVRAAEDINSNSRTNPGNVEGFTREIMRMQEQAKLPQPQFDRKAFDDMIHEMKRTQDEMSHLNLEETRKATAEAQQMLARLQLEFDSQSRAAARQRLNDLIDRAVKNGLARPVQ